MTSALIDAVVEYITHQTGLVLSPAQLQDLTAYVRRRTAVTGTTDFIALLDDPGEFRMLVDGLTVKETFFLRYQAQFDAFRDHLLPHFLSTAGAEQRHVRVWSAGCCTGEEAYTLALIASESGCLDRVEILATDINETYLEAAMEGVFSERSVANLPPPLIERYFVAKQGRFILNEAIKSRVTFKYLNLAEPVYPSFLNGTTAVDMIFCRNVLIYFEKTKVREIIERLGECLNPEGVLALGHSEMLPRDWTLSVRQVGDAFFYDRRPTPARATPQAADPAPAPRRQRRPAPAQVTSGVAELLAHAEQQANHGNSLEAARLCREAIALDASLERGHYLLGLLSLDSPLEARGHFREAVYLNPAHLPARLHLAECTERVGDVAEALLEYRNLERLAGAKPPEAILDPLEGITYGMLALIGSSARRRLE